MDTYPTPGGGGGLSAFLKFWVPSAEPPGEGKPTVGWDFFLDIMCKL